MKKIFFLLAFAMTSVFGWSQTTDVDMEKLFHVEDKYIELNDPFTLKQGIAFIGDTRQPENIQEDKYQGMRVQKQRRCFKVDGKVRQYNNSLMFRRAPRGTMKDHVMQLDRVPRSCMLQLKPLEGGKFTFCGQTSRDEAHLYIGVRNGDSFRVVSTLPFAKPTATGKKDDPWQTVTADYDYADGDELWIYADANINLFGLQFTGKLDATFQGSEPNEVDKAVRRALKKKNQ